MIHIAGANHCLKTIAVLSKPFADGPLDDWTSLKRAYQSFVGEHQPALPRSESIEPQFVCTGDKAKSLYQVFTAKSDLTDTIYGLEEIWDTNDGSYARKRLLIDEARESLSRLDPTLSSVFDLVFNFVYSTPSKIAGGGTTSQALGVLWIDPRPSWELRDAQEFLVHELGHMLLFLEEWRFGLYRDAFEMVAKENWALSAIRGSQRPLDKAFHSAVVGAEVLLLRERLLGHPTLSVLHPSSPELAVGILRSIRSIAEGPSHILSQRAAELMLASRDRVLEIGERRGWLSSVDWNFGSEFELCTT